MPIGAPQGISTSQPASTSRLGERRGPRSCREGPGSRRRSGSAPPRRGRTTSGCSVSSSPITSSLIQVGAEDLAGHLGGGDGFLDRMAAGGVRQDLAGRARGSATRMPDRPGPRPNSRRSDTVTTSAPDARTASARIAGEGYCAVPSRSRLVELGAVERAHGSASLHRRDDLEAVALGEASSFRARRRARTRR